MRSYRWMVVVTMGLTALATACGADEEAADEANPAAGEVGGLSREQIEAAAEPMSPEVAESLGIVDTTIRIQVPAPVETIPLGPTPPDSSDPRP